MSLSVARLKPTNLPAEDVVMDDREDGKDVRFYCLPPYYGKTGHKARAKQGGGYPFHLVSQGHQVGIFDNWLEAQASLSGYPDSANRGYHSVAECIDAWQALCPLGIHPHAVDPAFAKTPSASAAQFVNTSPRKGKTAPAPLKREEGAAAPLAPTPKHEGTSSGSAEDKAQVLADLKRFCSPVCSPPPSPTKAGAAGRRAAEEYVNFAIRGGGIVSSSPVRSTQRYVQMQRRGEQPDMLVTRSVEQASLFALSLGEEAGAGSETED
ncbi:hypothetical protein B0H13DRAFT_2342111 [Mycena leptocephala]|nr:hypothetical protein B0H13DRAFT_2342111 [Mycena leptocephala]